MHAVDTTILDFIGGRNKVCVIPPFQRNYEWSRIQCKELFEDIKKALETNKNHYLGNIVYYIGRKNGATFSELVLVDGQQRITTILIFLCALRDTMTDNEKVSNVSQYLLNSTSEDKYRMRLKQTSYDADTFIDLINKKDPKNHDNNIYKNYTNFVSWLKSETIKPEDFFDALEKLQIVDVNLQIENDLTAVQTVFEKINSTGTPLTPADLLRNYLLISDSVEEQERLYKEYWTEIENNIKTVNIPRFVRDYLVMKTYGDVIANETYFQFKNYIDENMLEKEYVLADMKKYSVFYSYLKFANSDEKNLNRIIVILKYLKADDVFPLYLYLIERMYSSDKKELCRILTLVKDFILRYRIVTPSSGGGSLRAVIQKLIEKIDKKEIDFTYDAIYFELSNSSALSGRFPTDDEFKKSLMQSNEKNYKYARAVLLGIEYNESTRPPVEFEDVTIEHLMPQTLSDTWKQNLGGKDKAEEIYETYLNCIGNLTPLSQSCNSKISNLPWNQKKDKIDFTGFAVSDSVKNISDWNESEIIKRNKDLAERACKAITSPLPRTRKYRTSLDDFESGEYSASDIETKMESTYISGISFDGEKFDVFSWNGYLNKICNILHRNDSVKFEKIVEENLIHKSTSKRNSKGKDPIITKDKSLLVSPYLIDGTEFYSEGTVSSMSARVYSKQLLDLYGVTEDVKLFVNKKEE